MSPLFNSDMKNKVLEKKIFRYLVYPNFLEKGHLCNFDKPLWRNAQEYWGKVQKMFSCESQRKSWKLASQDKDFIKWAVDLFSCD